MVEKRSLDLQAHIAAYQREVAPILVDLAKLGVHVDSLDPLINTAVDYRVAVPLLISWLPRVSYLPVKESLVRALTLKEAKGVAAGPLVEEYRKAPAYEESSLKWTIGNALSVVADDSVFDDIAELVRNKQHGRAREMLAIALGNMKDPRAVPLLMEVLDDEQVAGHALAGLRKLAPAEARSKVEPFLNHPKTWVRKEAQRTLKAIDRKAAGKSTRKKPGLRLLK
jgi:HEAT repeat protein